ncbi:unnamed protein product [Sphagnum jensenii]|uniref:Uncharacterized protein n=1 Tax=Sphagnum jensenii TaxID=128206 RepID=A0ABP1AKJ0_9BRYO
MQIVGLIAVELYLCAFCFVLRALDATVKVYIRERNPSLRCSWMFLSSMTLMHALVISSSIFSTDLIGDQSHVWSVFSHHV